jgi:hypothetical protein
LVQASVDTAASLRFVPVEKNKAGPSVDMTASLGIVLVKVDNALDWKQPAFVSLGFVPKIQGNLFEAYATKKVADIVSVYGNDDHQDIINLLGKDDDDLQRM